MAEDGYVDYRRASRANPFTNDASATESESEDLGLRSMPRPGGHGRDDGHMPTVAEASELPTSSGTEYVDYADEAQRRQRAGAEMGASDSDAAYMDRRPSQSRSHRSRASSRGFEKGGRANAFDVASDGEHSKDDDAYSRRDWRRGEPGAPPSMGPNALNDHVVPIYDEYKGASRIVLEIKQAISFGGTAAGFGLLFLLGIGQYLFAKINPNHKFPPRHKIDQAWMRRIPGERYSTRTEYYAEFWGYDCDAHDVETEDGFVLRMYHIKSRKRNRRPGPPILIQHGILCNSTHFVVNEERSMAFWFIEQGYDVWIGNIRTNFKMPHRRFERWDPRYWAWAVKEIGLYDCTASIEYVYEMTGGQRVNYVGHSQGGGTMFIALSQGMRPDIADKMASFAGLAPAVYAGPVLQKFPFTVLRLFRSRPLWSLAMGVREFVPILALFANILPAWLFGHLAIPTFFALFGFHDHNWVPRQVPKLFRSTPVSTSSELLYFYMGNFAETGCFFDENHDGPWFPEGFPPFGLWYGDLDTLVDGGKLLERLRDFEPNVPLHVAYGAYTPPACPGFTQALKELRDHEHLDPVWGAGVVEEVFIPMLRFFENASFPTGAKRRGSSKSVSSKPSKYGDTKSQQYLQNAEAKV